MKTHFYSLTLYVLHSLFPASCMLFAAASLFAQTPERQWIKADFPGGSFDVVTDRDHYVYATQTTRTTDDDAILTVKYSPSGEIERSFLYDNTSRHDKPVAMAIAADGSVYVVGISYTVFGLDADVMLIKYNFTGTRPAWVRHFNGEANLSDEAVALAIDPLTQNVVVIVNSQLTTVDSEIVTLRYTPGGTPLPTLHENVLPFGDYASALKIDLSGNIYVAGVTYNSETGRDGSSDRILMGYRATGEHFRYLYNRGSDEGSLPTRNYTRGLGIDEEGGVYTIGYDDTNMTLLKYAADGTYQKLVDQIREPYVYPSFAVDNSRNVYIGWTVSNLMNVYKYSPAHGLQPHGIYENTSTSPLRISGMKVDGLGNLYCTVDRGDLGPAPFYVCLKYSSAGNLIWTIDSRSPTSYEWKELHAFHIDYQYNVYVAGIAEQPESGYNGFVAKYLAPVPSVISPDALAEFRRVDLSMGARERECWNDMLVGWEPPPCEWLYFCGDPVMRLSLINAAKITWQQKFNKPFEVSFPDPMAKNTLLFEKEVGNVFQPVIIVDDNLVPNGFTTLNLSIFPGENRISVKAETDKGIQVPFTISLLNKDGKSVWQEDLVAPVEKELTGSPKDLGVTLKITSANKLALNYFPNPFSGKLNVDIENNTKAPGDLSVYTLQGKKITGQLVQASGRYSVDMPNEKPGLYIMILKIGGNETHKLIELKR